MKITNKLTDKEIEDIKELLRICKIERIPNFDTSIYIDTELPCFYLEYVDDKLVSFLSLFYVDIKEIEVVGMTHPDFRREGYFSLLLKEAKKVIPNNIPILYQVPSECVDKEKLNSLGYEYHHGEFEMIKKIAVRGDERLQTMEEADVEDVARILADAFDDSVEEEVELIRFWQKDEGISLLVLREGEKTVGFIATSKVLHIKTLHLFAFCVDKNHRSKGYGKRVLSNLPFNSAGYVLRVDHDNLRAKKLYDEVGFTILSSTEYYLKK
ncbi:MAG: GNAT family N-acetyltransferase [Sphaerochaeta sp.]